MINLTKTEEKMNAKGVWNMSKKGIVRNISLMLAAVLGTVNFGGCGEEASSDRAEVEMVCYKPEAVKAFEKIEARFNETHDDIHLTISSPNEAMTILKTRFIREDYPDIIGIGGDSNYSNFLDADLFLDISELEELEQVKKSYLQMDKELEFVPQEGAYALPYAANAAGVLYNKEMFQKYGWEIPETWEEFMTLCNEIQSCGIQPLYFGFKDTWTCLAPWNALAVGLADSDICSQVNREETTFKEAYRETAEKIKALLPYAEENPYAYSYNDACTAFARGESAMYPIGSYAIPQIKSVNPDMKIDSFVFPANDSEKENVLNSGIDLQFCVMKYTEQKEAVYYFVPNILGGLVIGYIFSLIFTYILPVVGDVFGIGFLQNSILASEKYAWIGVLIVGVWQAVAMNTIIYISGLQTVPSDVYEASMLDGAGKWKEFWKVTFPLVMPFVTINLILSTKNFLMVFDQILSLTKGGPAQSTESISYLIYKNGMDGGQFGFQSANAVLFFVVIVAISIFQMTVMGKKEEQL